MTELGRAPAMGFRESTLISSHLVTYLPITYTIDTARWQEIKTLAALPVGPHRSLRVDLEWMLNQNNGTFYQTNQIAADLAITVHRNQKQEYKRLIDQWFDEARAEKGSDWTADELHDYFKSKFEELP